MPLRSLPARFTYLYDFGDDWEHEVEVIGAGGDRPGVVAGEGACPPEDVGGPHGYADFLKALANPRDSEHDHMQAWAGTWSDSFDLATADLLVRRPSAQFQSPVRLVLGLAADGVNLTPGGRLPRALVRQVQEHYPSWYPLGRPASIEEDLPPLAALHDLLREVGLLRLRKGVLSPTRARRRRQGGDPTPPIVVRTAATATRSLLTTDALALLAAEGPSRPQDLAGRLLDLLGDRWVTSKDSVSTRPGS